MESNLRKINPLNLYFISISICIFIILPITNSFSQTSQIKFENISLSEGLSQSYVTSIMQGNKGFMWFGTADGLNRYDGYNFKVYKNNPRDTNSLPTNNIQSIYEDKAGIIWIGTEGGGLCRFNTVTGKFIQYQHDPLNSKSISNNRVFDIYETPYDTNSLWLATNWGLDKLDKKTGIFTNYLYNPDNVHSISNNYVRSIIEDKKGKLWIGTWGGLNLFDINKNYFIRYKHNPADPNSLISNNIQAIIGDSKNYLWIGTFNGGLSKFEPGKNRFTNYTYEPGNPNCLSNNNVSSIIEVSPGILWLGTLNGLDIYNETKGKFTVYKHNKYKINSLCNNRINTIYKSSSGIIWIGTNTGGIDKVVNANKNFHRINLKPIKDKEPGYKSIYSICESGLGKDIIWIGAGTKILYKYNCTKQSINCYPIYPESSHIKAYVSIRAILADHSGVLWLGTTDGLIRANPDGIMKFHYYVNDPKNPHSSPAEAALNAIAPDPVNPDILWLGFDTAGLCKFNKRTGKFTFYLPNKNIPNSISNNRITTIKTDHLNKLWVGTFDGLNQFDRVTGKCIRYKHDKNNPNSLSSNHILSIYEDKEYNLWIGTVAGLNEFIRGKNKFIVYLEGDGLPNNTVYGILEDNNGNLWLSTNKGLSQFNPRTGKFRNFDVEDGLQSNEFNTGAYFKNANDEMFFGGINGINYFYPDSIKLNHYIPPVVITDFQLFNKSVKPGENSLIKNPISEENEIHLTYEDQIFSFGFASLDFNDPSKNQYAYMMVGLNKNWNYIRTRHFVTFTTLTQGEYTFRVIGSNNDGIWNKKGASIKIFISPPPWETFWAYVLYFLFGIGIIFSYIRYKTNKQRKELLIKQKELQLIKENEAAREKAYEAVKREKETRRIYTHKLLSVQEEECRRISHELHDSIGQDLLVIKNLIHLGKRNGINIIENESYYDKISDSASRAINEIRDISRALHPIQLEKLGLTLSIESLINLFKESTQVEIVSKIDNIDCILKKENEIHLYRIIQESLNNIIKHAEADKVNFSIKNTPGIIRISICDNGKGFEYKEAQKQSDGMGLTSISERVSLLKGELEFKTGVNIGTEIIIVLKAK